MRKLILCTTLASVALVGCGGDAPLPPPKRPAAAPGRGGGAGPAAKPTGGAPLVLKPKVDRMYRKEFTPADFQPDPTGDVNRDPFYSYLVTPAAQPGQAVPIEDECTERKVAEKYAYNDLRLLGIVMRGTKNFAMFRDPAGVGQVAYQGDCLGKDKARIVEITPSCVRIEIRGIAPPGAPAPPAHDDKRCLHPDDIEIQ
jgi:Tfp pilus assembly protein PilP